MDPETQGWLKLLQGGGNAAAIAALFIAWQVFKQLKELLGDVVSRLGRIERAIVASNPKALAIINSTDKPAEQMP